MDPDVIIIGGRPAGAGLAARLGALGVSTAVLERARFPCEPFVPSAPILHPGAMALLDEIGLDEARYAPPEARLGGVALHAEGYFRAVMPTAKVAGRDYVASVERAPFDHALWEHLGSWPSVSREPGFIVEGVLRDGDRVVGVRGKQDGAPRELRARVVIGADGRTSPLSHMVGAATLREEQKYVGATYFAIWEDLKLGVDEPAGYAAIHTRMRGLDALFFPLSASRAFVCVHTQTGLVSLEGGAEAFYLDRLRSMPGPAAKLEGARQVSRLLGLKRIENGFRQAGGPGWALVGDAVHYKDPVDAQGIYDALRGGKVLAAEIAAFLGGSKPWEQAVADYERALHAFADPMFEATLGRLQRELYSAPPALVIRSLIRWMMTDPAYQDAYMRYTFRELDPRSWMPGMGGVIWRGILRDLA